MLPVPISYIGKSVSPPKQNYYVAQNTKTLKVSTKHICKFTLINTVSINYNINLTRSGKYVGFVHRYIPVASS